MSEPTIVQVEPLRRFCTAAFESAGVSSEDAALVTDTLLEADLRGVHSHGVWWVPVYIRRIHAGGLKPRPKLKVVRETVSMLLLDADSGMGQVASIAAMQQAIQKAKSTGVGVATVRNSNHFGAAAYYALLAAKENMIGFATTDAEPIMAPWGGAQAVVGNNPLAYAIPVNEAFTLVLDMAQSVVAWGKIFLAAQRGEKIPATWALNPTGKPTEDPQAAMAGLLQPVGGYKGYGLATVMEILSSVISGATFGLRMPLFSNDSATQGFGHFFTVLDISQFMPLPEFQERMAMLVAEHRNVPLAQGVERIYLPGEIEHQKREQRLKTGIPLEAYIVESLVQFGQKAGLETSGLA